VAVAVAAVAVAVAKLWCPEPIAERHRNPEFRLRLGEALARAPRTEASVPL
jgi:hypothetical protein